LLNYTAVLDFKSKKLAWGGVLVVYLYQEVFIGMWRKSEETARFLLGKRFTSCIKGELLYPGGNTFKIYLSNGHAVLSIFSKRSTSKYDMELFDTENILGLKQHEIPDHLQRRPIDVVPFVYESQFNLEIKISSDLIEFIIIESIKVNSSLGTLRCFNVQNYGCRSVILEGQAFAKAGNFSDEIVIFIMANGKFN